jgi:hypothetical protein
MVEIEKRVCLTCQYSVIPFGVFFERTEEHLFNQVTLGDDGTQAHTSSVSNTSPPTQRCVRLSNGLGVRSYFLGIKRE